MLSCELILGELMHFHFVHAYSDNIIYNLNFFAFFKVIFLIAIMFYLLYWKYTTNNTHYCPCIPVAV